MVSRPSLFFHPCIRAKFAPCPNVSAPCGSIPAALLGLEETFQVAASFSTISGIASTFPVVSLYLRSSSLFPTTECVKICQDCPVPTTNALEWISICWMLQADQFLPLLPPDTLKSSSVTSQTNAQWPASLGNRSKTVRKKLSIEFQSSNGWESAVGNYHL